MIARKKYWGITVEINYVRTNITFTRAGEMPFGGRQESVILPHSKAFQTHLQPPPGPEQKYF